MRALVASVTMVKVELGDRTDDGEDTTAAGWKRDCLGD
jgi:hypothetical protein